MPACSNRSSSRRALLTGAVTGLAITAATQLTRPLSTLASDGEPVRLGAANAASTRTAIACTDDLALDITGPVTAISAASTDGLAIVGESKRFIGVVGRSLGNPDPGDPHVVGIGVVGTGPQEGVHGESPTGFAVAGITQTGEGVHADAFGVAGVAVSANSPSGVAVQATSDTGTAVIAGSPNGSAMIAWSDGTGPDAVAVRGSHAEGDAVVGWSKKTTGVRGIGEDQASGMSGESPTVGVAGRTSGETNEQEMFQANVVGVLATVAGPGGFGIGVKGDGANGVGVLGQGVHCGVHGYGDKAGVAGKSLAGDGVSGSTQSGVALRGDVFAGGSGIALAAHGPVIFDSAGCGKLTGGKAKVTPGVALDPTSKVLVTLMGDPGPQAQAPYVVVTPGAAGTGFFELRVPNARRVELAFAWFVIG